MILFYFDFVVYKYKQNKQKIPHCRNSSKIQNENS